MKSINTSTDIPMAKDMFLKAELDALCLKLFCLVVSFVCPTPIQNVMDFHQLQSKFNFRTLSLMLFFISLPKVCRNKGAEMENQNVVKKKK